MKKLLFLFTLMLFPMLASATDVKINETTFPDSNFRNWVLAQDYGADGVLTDKELKNVTDLDVRRLEIHNLKGIEYFTALKVLNCITNKLTTLDLSHNTALEKLECVGNRLTTINLLENKKLRYLSCPGSNQGNQLTTLDVSRCTELDTLACSGNPLTTLDVSKNTKLKCLECYSNQLTALDLSKNTVLSRLHCNDNKLTMLDLSKNTSLEMLQCSSNLLTALDITNNLALTCLNCANNKLTKLYVTNNKSLEWITCPNNQLTSLDVSGCSALKSLGCNDNQLSTLNLSGCSALEHLSCQDNQLNTLDLSENIALIMLYCYHNQIKGTGMDALVKSLPTVSEGSLNVMYLENEQNVMTTTQVAAAKAKGWISYYWNDAFKSWKEYAGIETTQEYFPDGTKWTEIRLDTLKYDSWYSKVGNEWVPNFETIEYYVKGEYPDMDWVYKKVYTNGPEWTDSLTLLIRETEYNGHNSILASVLSHEYDGDKVQWPGETYQFDWSIGKGLYYEDITMSNTTSMRQPRFYYGIIDEIKERNFGGVRPLKYVDLDGKAPDDETGLNRYVSTNGGRIIQGIGITEWNDGECLFGPTNPYFALTGETGQRHYRSMLVHFERNGEVLYNVWPEASLQDDYIPFVKAGKRWHVVRSEFDKGYHFDQFMLMNEKVEKAGKTYMKMYRTEDLLAVVYDAGLLREEDRKVYFFDSGMQKEFLLFDYSMKTGDTYETYSYDEQKMVTYKVVSVGDYREGPKVERSVYNQAADSAETQHRYLQKWIVCRTGNEALQKTWIEGIGSLEGPLANLYDVSPVSVSTNLAYVEFGDELYLPFSFYDTMNKQVHGCNLPTGAENREDDDVNHQLIYELEGNRLHVYGEVFTQCGPNNYAYFIEKPTDDPLVNKIEFGIQEVEPLADCMALHTTNFYVPGFDPNLNYIVVDNRGEEHPVINKTPQMAYRPFIEEGKVWKVGDVSDNPVKLVEYYYFEGDTIIDGKTCKQMMCQRYVSSDHPDYSAITQYPLLTKVGTWYEEDQKVYVYDAQNKQHKLMYDFSLEPYDTLQFLNMEGYPPLMIGPKQTGGLKGFKGVYRNIMGINIDSRIYTSWLEGVGGIMGPIKNTYYYEKIGIEPFLMSCTVGDEVIYLNDEYQDGAASVASNAPMQRLDFTHIIKSKPRAPMMRTAEQPLYGEYNDQQLGINLDPLAEAYLVRINNESGKTVYEKVINAGNIVALTIDISAYPKGRYTVTIENSRESFTGQFYAQTTGIVEATSKKPEVKDGIYNLQGQRISTLQKGLNIVNGRKVLVK